MIPAQYLLIKGAMLQDILLFIERKNVYGQKNIAYRDSSAVNAEISAGTGPVNLLLLSDLLFKQV